MKVKELINLLNKCNQDADITSTECRFYDRKYYYPVSLEYLYIEKDGHSYKESDQENANVILIH